MAGILAATVANHFLAALVGSEVASFLDGKWFRYLIAFSFIAMAIWTLIPDKLDEVEDKPARFGAFVSLDSSSKPRTTSIERLRS